jgi:hypothetical protein
MTVFNGAFLIVSTIGLGYVMSKGCGAKKEIVVNGTEEPPVAGAITCGGAKLGTPKKYPCADGSTGSILKTCQAGENGSGEWYEVDNTCKPPIDTCTDVAQDKVTFEKDIKSIIVDKCVSCHTSPEDYSSYAVAKSLMSEPNYDMLDRINRTNNSRMPKPPNPPLSAGEKELFNKWLDDGLLENSECSTTDSGGNEFKFLNLDYVEEKIVADLQRNVSSDDRINTRYVLLTHKYNQKPDAVTTKQFKDAIFKSTNSLSTKDQLGLATPIDVRETIFRINLEDFDFDAPIGQTNDWDKAILVDPFKFESFTTTGVLIKQLTGTNQPWLHADNYAFITHNKETYYDTLGIAGTEKDLYAQLGTNLQESYDKFEIQCAGGFGSPISINKNRKICRAECERSALCKDQGYVWQTYDPVAGNGVRERNLFEFPFGVEARSALIFQHAASEVIWTLPNGLQGYFLSLANGARQNFADPAVVTDIGTDKFSSFDPQIDNAVDCQNCHYKGILSMEDSIRSALGNSAELGKDDRDKVKAYFPTQNTLAATFTKDSKDYLKTLDTIGVVSSGGDPVSALLVPHRSDWGLTEFCSFVMLNDDLCRECIDGSGAVKAQIGQLLNNGGVVSRDQIVQSFALIKDEWGIGQEEIDE